MKYFLFLLLVLKLQAPTESLKLKDLGKSAVDLATGVVKKLPDSIPSADNLFEIGKNVLAGYGFEMVWQKCTIDWKFLMIKNIFIQIGFLGHQ